jgi:hypothetical protein
MGWFDNLSDPASVKRLKLSEYLFFVAPSGEITSPDKWYRQFNDPVRRIATATRYEQPSWSLFPDNVTYSWLTPWPDLVRRVPPTRYEQPSWSLPGEISSVDKWFSSLSDPTRRKGLATALNPSFFYDPPPFIVSYSWFGELRDPVRRPPMATRYEQQSWSLFVEPTAVTFGWFDNLSDPTRRNPDLGAYQRVRYPFAAIAARMSWYAPLSNPVRLPIGIKVQLQPYFQYSPNPTTITSFGWFDNLSDPVRKRPMATRYEQPSWSLFREDAKFTANQFTDPVRIPRPVPHSYFVTSLFPPTPSFGWFGGLSEPVRIKPRVRWLDEQSFQFPFTPLPGSWYAPWREPTPPKRRNPFFQPFTFTATPPIIPSFGWYGSLSNPRWNKPKVWEGQYQAWNPATINFSYLARMDAYETRDFLVAVLYAFNPPLRAYVDIIEKDPRHRGEMGVIENAPEPSIIASIVTPQAIPATGTPIAAVRARVAIIVS